MMTAEQSVLWDVRRILENDKQLARIRKKIDSGKATFADTAAYSERASTLLGEAIGKHILAMPTETREALCVELLRDRYTDINQIVDRVQRAMDEAQGVHLAPQRAPFNSERAHQIGRSTADMTVPEETQQRRARAAMTTASKSCHDDRMKAEAKFRSSAGLKCHITRSGSSDCCSWCAEVMGTFEFGDEPDDIFRRHDNCDCTVIYDSRVLRGKHAEDDGHLTKTWEEIGELPSGFQSTVFDDSNRPIGAAVTVLSPEQAKETQARILQRISTGKQAVN